VLAPLTDTPNPHKASEFHAEDLVKRPFTEIDLTLRAAAADLANEHKQNIAQ
jgi:hypothetical protein